MRFEELKEELGKEYYTRNDIRNIEDFYLNYDKVNKIFGRNKQTEKIVCFYDKKLNNVCKEEIKNSLLGHGLTTCMISPTNSGKTFTMVNKVFKEINAYNILCVPARAQAQQVGEAYNITDVVGGSDSLKDRILLDKIKEFVMVYDCLTPDSIKQIYDILKMSYSDIVLNLVIDEAHNITSSSNYRCKAIRNIEEVSKQIIDNKGNVIYMTATPLNLVNKSFDRVVHFIREADYTANTNRFNLFVNETGKSFSSFAHRILLTEGSGIVRYNRIASTHSLKYYMEKYDGIKNILYTNSDEKGYLVVNGKRVYNNELTNFIINYEKLPNNSYAFITSMGDAGINITTVDVENKEDYKGYFLVDSICNMDVMNIEQFFNRLRFKNNSYNLLINKTNKEEVGEKKEFYMFVEEEYNRIQDKINCSKDLINFYAYMIEQGELKATLEEAKENLDKTFKMFGIDGIDNNKSLYIDDFFHLQFDENLFMNECWKKYNNQFYNNIDLLIKELKRIFNIDINVVYYDEVIDNINDKKIYEEMCANQIFNNVKEIIDENFEKEDNSLYNIIKESDAYKDFKKAFAQGQKPEDIAANLISSSRKELKEERLKKTNEQIDNLDMRDIKALYDITHKKETKYYFNRDLVEKVLTDELKDFLSRVKEDDIVEALKWFKSSSSNRDLEDYFTYKHSIFINEMFKKDKVFNTKELKEQKLIREYFTFEHKGYREVRANIKTCIFNTKMIYELIVYLSDNNIKTVDYKQLVNCLYSMFEFDNTNHIRCLNRKFDIDLAIQYHNKAKEEIKNYKKIVKKMLEEEHINIKIK